MRACSSTYTRSACGRAKVTFCSPSSTVMRVVSRSRRQRLRQLLQDHRRQAQGRLVQDQQLRLHHQRPGDRQHLLLAARQRARRLTLAFAQDREQIEQPVQAAGPAPSLPDAGRRDPDSPARSCRRTARAFPGTARRRRARSRRGCGRAVTRRPSGSRPRYGTRPEIALNSVVLPAPFSPTTETNSPSFTWTETLCSACALP